MSASKRHQLGQRALDVFHADGFRATGMDVLAAASEVTKADRHRPPGSAGIAADARQAAERLVAPAVPH